MRRTTRFLLSTTKLLSAGNKSGQPEKPTIVQITLSALAAAIGVQSNRNRERDFKHSSIIPYIVAGVLFTTCFVLSVAFIVQAVIKSAGS